jgi:hypothetical protein
MYKTLFFNCGRNSSEEALSAIILEVKEVSQLYLHFHTNFILSATENISIVDAKAFQKTFP